MTKTSASEILVSDGVTSKMINFQNKKKKIQMIFVHHVYSNTVSQ